MRSSTQFEPQYSEPITLFLRAVFVYVCLFSVASLLQSGLFKLLVNLTAIAIFLILLVNWAFMPSVKMGKVGNGIVLGLSLYYLGLLGSVFFNLGSIDFPDLLKFIMAPMFLLFGVVFEARRRETLFHQSNNKHLFFLLIIIPLLFWAVQLATGKTSYGSGEDVAFFPNRNTASLYAVTLLALYNVLAEKPLKNIWIYVVVAFMFGALGVLFAVLLSLFITVSNRSTYKYLFVFFAIVAALYINFPDVGVFARLDAVFGSIGLLMDGRINLNNVSYGDIVRILNTTDLSFIFRLKHWLELYQYYSYGNLQEIIFGFGVGSTVGMTATQLIPHNDYLRLLLEMGVFTLLGFVILMALIVKVTWRRWEAVPLLAVVLYFFSENLINSYASMITFYFSAGVIMYRIQQEESANAD